MKVRFVAKRGDALTESALNILSEAGYSVGWRGEYRSEPGEFDVILFRSPIRQDNAVNLAVYRVKNWRGYGGKGNVLPLLIFLMDGVGNDFRSSILDAARRYSEWNPRAGQLAPFPIFYRSMSPKTRDKFESWFREVGRFTDIPAGLVTRWIRNLRQSVPDEQRNKKIGSRR